MKRSISQFILLLLLSAPFLIYWFNYIFINPSQNFYINDPEFAYFLNSLGAFKGVPFAYYDHPGTPMEMIGVLILALTYPFFAGKPGGFINYHIQHYWVFLNLSHYFVLLIHLASIWTVFSILQKKEEKNTLIPAVISLMYFALHSFSITATLLWEHNAFSFPLGTPLLIGLYLVLMNARGKGVPTKSVIALGLGAGFMAAFTIYMIAWSVGIFTTFALYFILQKFPVRKALMDLIVFITSTAVGFILGVLPIFNKLGRFVVWAFSILDHRSNYLAVPKDQSRSTRMLENLRYLFQSFPLMVFLSAILLILLVFATILIWRQKSCRNNEMMAMAWGISFQLILLTIVFLDRPIRDFYLLSLAAIIPFIALPVGKLLSFNNIFTIFLCSVTVLGLINTTINGFSYKKYEISSLADSKTVVGQSIKEYAQMKDENITKVRILWTAGTYSPCWRLWYGNRRSNNNFAREVAVECPNQYEFAGRVWLPYDKVPLEDFPWDIIFTCDRSIDTITAKEQVVTIERHPEVQWTCGPMVVVFHK